MKTAILSSESDSDIKLLVELANKLGIKTKILTEEDVEDLAMVYAIEEGKTGGIFRYFKFYQKPPSLGNIENS